MTDVWLVKDPPEVSNKRPSMEKYLDTASTNIITILIMCDYMVSWVLLFALIFTTSWEALDYTA